MIAAGEEPRAIERPEVCDLLHNAQHLFVAARVAADGARVGRVDIAADRAGRELVGDLPERSKKRLKRRLALLHQVKHGAPGRPRPKARQSRQRLRECFYFLTGHSDAMDCFAKRSKSVADIRKEANLDQWSKS